MALTLKQKCGECGEVHYRSGDSIRWCRKVYEALRSESVCGGDRDAEAS